MLLSSLCLLLICSSVRHQGCYPTVQQLSLRRISSAPTTSTECSQIPSYPVFNEEERDIPKSSRRAKGRRMRRVDAPCPPSSLVILSDTLPCHLMICLSSFLSVDNKHMPFAVTDFDVERAAPFFCQIQKVAEARMRKPCTKESKRNTKNTASRCPLFSPDVTHYDKGPCEEGCSCSVNDLYPERAHHL